MMTKPLSCHHLHSHAKHCRGEFDIVITMMLVFVLMTLMLTLTLMLSWKI